MKRKAKSKSVIPVIPYCPDERSIPAVNLGSLQCVECGKKHLRILNIGAASIVGADKFMDTMKARLVGFRVRIHAHCSKCDRSNVFRMSVVVPEKDVAGIDHRTDPMWLQINCKG